MYYIGNEAIHEKERMNKMKEKEKIVNEVDQLVENGLKALEGFLLLHLL